MDPLHLPSRSEGIKHEATVRCPTCGTLAEKGIRFCPYDGTSLAAVDDSEGLIGQRIAGKYRVLDRLAVGGMGAVYLAEQEHPHRRVALKVIRHGAQFDPIAVQRLQREANNAGSFTNTHVAAVYDSGVDADGRAFMVMEYVPGETLAAVLERESLLPPRRALSIAWQVCDGLCFAHERGIVHRDLKPANIMLDRRRDGSDLVKIVDFGISRSEETTSQALTSKGVVLGTPRYMSPEQLSDGTVDCRTDIYALGLIVIQMLTGRLPWDGAGDATSLMQRLTIPAKTLAQLHPIVEWPSSLQAVVNRALAITPADRHPDVVEFRDELTQAILEWIPNNPAAHTPWDVRFEYATPIRIPSFPSTPLPPREPPPREPLPTEPLPAPSNRNRVRALVGSAATVLAVASVLWVARPRMDQSRAAGAVTADSGTREKTDSGVGLVDRGGAGVVSRGPKRPSGGDTTVKKLTGVGAGDSVEKLVADHATDSVVKKDAPSADSLRTVLDRMKKLTGDSSATTDDARNVLHLGDGLVRHLHSAADSVEAQYYMVEAYLLLDDPASACALLRRIEQPSQGTRFRALIASILGHQQLGCR